MERNSIIKKLMYASDMVLYVQKYMEIMDEYYLKKENNEKIDVFAMEEYVKFKEECEKGAKERGII